MRAILGFRCQERAQSSPGRTRGPSFLCLCLQGLFSSHQSSGFAHGIPSSSFLQGFWIINKGKKEWERESSVFLLHSSSLRQERFLGQYWRSVGCYPLSLLPTVLSCQAVPNICISRLEGAFHHGGLVLFLVLITQGLTGASAVSWFMCLSRWQALGALSSRHCQ